MQSGAVEEEWVLEERRPSSLDFIVLVFLTTYISSGRHPAVAHDTMVCCNSAQFLVSPINSGVCSRMCGLGGRFHGGVGGRSATK